MLLRSLWSALKDKPTSDALDYITKRINLVWAREHNGETGTHAFPAGVWAPTIGGTGGESGQTYAQQNGYYLKAGPLVHLGCRVQLSTLGTITGAVQIKGVPFPSVNHEGYRATGVVAWTTTTAAFTNIVAIINAGTAVLDLVGAAGVTTSLTTQPLVQANLAATTRFLVSLVYEAEA